ncbi:MAG TPA: S-formylglutathione hydrolase [Salinisphaera sp.]|nr:S-formylglutathione hydrolase [Salinisphaera sp.]HET7315356.1 S-formylglutathione hydrolase [Salinisphaera sp.]
MKQIDEHKSHEGWQRRYAHASKVCGCEMTFALYLPPAAEHARVPVVYWLSGLTCTDENFVNKAGAQGVAAELGIAIVAPDTSPRGAEVADEDAYDLGQGAGFYVNATRSPWSRHYRMYDYVVTELPELLGQQFGDTLDLSREAIAGHSMGGHGALVIGLRNPDRFAAISAFSAICNPVAVPWGEKAFAAYLGDDRVTWREYDASIVISHAENGAALPPILLEQGLADGFLEEQLKPERLEAAAEKAGAPVEVRRRDGYDHSYFFIATFIGEHLRFLARYMGV